MPARIIAADTGGIPIVNTGNYTGNFRRIVRDNSAYYVLAFYSSAGRDGKDHRVDIRVKARPELSVRAANGYRASSPDVKGPGVKLPKNISANARQALARSTPITEGLPLEIFTAVYRADGYDGSVMVGTHLPGNALKLERNERLELSYAAVDRWGAVRAVDRRAFTLTFNEDTRARVETTGLRLFGRLSLPRGRYEIRVAAHQPGGATGSAVTAIDIPDYTELPLSISDLVVASSNGLGFMTLDEDPVLRSALPTQPTPARTFSSGETLTVFGEIYDSHWILSRQVGVTTALKTEGGTVLHRSEEILRSGNRGRLFYTGRVLLETLQPGAYELTLEAYTRDGIPASGSQQLRFHVLD
jgi:hypothetical protein